jgi:hypothetical protein
MKRRREIAAAPERSTSETVAVISELIHDTLARSEKIDVAEVDEALDVARPALLALVAGGHLRHHPLILVAAELHLSITSVSGDKAPTLDENLDAVPGAASATEWTLYLPTPDPLGSVVERAAKGHARLSCETPPDDTDDRATGQSSAAALDLDALLKRGRE